MENQEIQAKKQPKLRTKAVVAFLLGGGGIFATAVVQQAGKNCGDHLAVSKAEIASSAATLKATADPCESLGTAESSRRRSEKGDVKIAMAIENNCSAMTLEVYWVDYTAKENLSAQLKPGEIYSAGTFYTHLWRLRDAATGRLIKEFAAGTSDMRLRVP